MKRHSQRLRDILRRGLAIAVTVPMMVSFAPVAFAEDGAGTGNGSATPFCFKRSEPACQL